MRELKWFLLGLSALLNALSHTGSPFLWWLSFCAWTPLFYAAATEKLSFKEGFYWGCLFILGNMWGVFYSLALMAAGPFFARMIPGLIITFYLALYAALWFWITSKLVTFFGLERSIGGKFALWLITALAFTWWMDNGSLWIFNIFEGYFLFHPLLPLAERIEFLSLLPMLGLQLLSFLMLATNCLLALFFLVPFWWQRLLILVLAAAPWVVSKASSPAPRKIPAWVSEVAVVPAWIYEPFDLSKIGKVIEEKLEELIKKNPQIKVAILPESSLYKCNLQSVAEIARKWNMQHKDRHITVIVGAAHWEKEHCYNSAYLLRNGAIEAIYDKRHTMILTEGLAPWWNCGLVRLLYQSTENLLAASTKPHPLWTLIPGVTCVPYICSELFFNAYPDDTFSHEMLLVICNDDWSTVPYIAHLMFLATRFKSLLWQRDILYGGYQYALYCSKEGALSRSIKYDL